MPRAMQEDTCCDTFSSKMKVTSLIKNKTPSVKTKRISGLRLEINPSPAKQSYSASSAEKSFADYYTFSRENFRGVGCSASVYVAQDSQDNCELRKQPMKKVVKVYNTNDEGNVEAARNEVRILQKLPPHENIVKLVEHFE